VARDLDGSTSSIDLGVSSLLDPVFPMTVGCWINYDVIALNGGYVFCHGRAGTGGWAFIIRSTGTSFTKLGAVQIDSPSLSLVSGTWFFVSATVTSTNVRFLSMTTGLTVVTADVANAAAFVATANDENIIGYLVAAGGTPTADTRFDGRIQHLGVWIGDALTDAQLIGFARNGLDDVPQTEDLFMPLCGLYSPEPDLSANAFRGTLSSTGVTTAAGPFTTIYCDTSTAVRTKQGWPRMIK
jgi:hypothetical protein